jgi:hypothetical protein
LVAGWVTNQQNLFSFISHDESQVVRLKGAEVNTTAHTVQDGFVAYGGLVYPVDYHTYTTPGVGEVAYWKIEEYEAGIPAGVKIFQDSTTHDVYSYYRLKVEVGTTIPAGAVAVANTVYVGDVLRDVVNTKEWILFTDNSDDYFYGPGLTPNGMKRRYFMDIDGFVHLKGAKYLDDVTVPTNITCCNLPVGFRPPHDIFQNQLITMSDELAYFFTVKIEAATGDVKLLGARGNGSFYFNQIIPFSVKS